MRFAGAMATFVFEEVQSRRSVLRLGNVTLLPRYGRTRSLFRARKESSVPLVVLLFFPPFTEALVRAPLLTGGVMPAMRARACKCLPGEMERWVYECIFSVITWDLDDAM